MNINPDDMLSNPPGGSGHSEEVEQLLREAKAAIKMGDKVSARQKLQEVVALDQYNEQGWYWLASVVETDDERRVCLGNVIVINPNNEKAKQLLDKLSGNPNAGLLLGDVTDERRSTLSLDTPEVINKLKTNPRLLIIGGVAAGGLLLLILVFLMGGRGAPPVPTLRPTTDETEQKTSVAAIPTTAVPTHGGTVEPTITPPLVAPTLPPTWTPGSQPAGGDGSGNSGSNGNSGTPIPPPSDTLGLPGRLVGISGSLVVAHGNMPVIMLDPYGRTIQSVSGAEVGDDAVLTPDGTRIIFSRYIAATDSKQLRIMNANGTEGRELSKLWGNNPPLSDVRQPNYASGAPLLTFSAASITQNDATPDIYVVATDSVPMLTSGVLDPPGPLLTNDENAPMPTLAPTSAVAAPPIDIPPAQLRRITDKNSGTNLWPTFAPNNSQIAYVSDIRSMGVDAVDIYVVDINTMTIQNLTNDQSALIEAAPDYSFDGLMIAYQGAPSGSKKNDIYTINVDGTNRQQITDGVGDNIRPHWSPDGRFIAFSSNRSGRWQIYVIEVATKTMYQVTRMRGSTICTGWYY